MYVEETRPFSYGTCLGSITNHCWNDYQHPFPWSFFASTTSGFGASDFIQDSTYPISNAAPCRIHLSDIKPTVLVKTQLSFGDLTLKTQRKAIHPKGFLQNITLPKSKFKSKLSKFQYCNSCTNFHG